MGSRVGSRLMTQAMGRPLAGTLSGISGRQWQWSGTVEMTLAGILPLRSHYNVTR
jgi:hypothetical protein